MFAAETALGRAQPGTSASEAPAMFSLKNGREPMTLPIADAGHIAPYLNGREVETEPALPLGLDIDAVFAEKTLQSSSKDHLTILTDSVPEAENHKELFGFARTENLSTHRTNYIADAARELGQNDDITVLTLTLLRAGTANA